MKKLLFIALLSLVTLGAKAYTVVFDNQTSCTFNFDWGSSTGLSVPPGQTGYTEFQIGTIFVYGESNCCGLTNGGANITTTAVSNSNLGTFSILVCSSGPIAYYNVLISYDSTIDTYTVLINF